MLTDDQVREYVDRGQLTLECFFSLKQIDEALFDLDLWSEEFLSGLRPEDRKWYVESSAGATSLRKLDDAAFQRPVFRSLATTPRLVAIVEQLIGAPTSVFFSQVFLKPPEQGSPKPAHQDNFYFGPADPDGLITVWIALDAATLENGCLLYAAGSHRRAVLPHKAPADQPFNLQVPTDVAGCAELKPVPIGRGGVSLHHGNTLHSSGANRSPHPRRAVAFHYRRRDVALVNPALTYDPQKEFRVG